MDKRAFLTISASLCIRLIVILLLILTLTPVLHAHAAGVLYAKPAAEGSEDCSSWLNACTL